MQAAPYPSDVRAQGWRFVLDYERVVQSDTWALASARQKPLLLMLWFVAWQQTPCGSLPDGDELIAARLGLAPDEFPQHREVLLRKWWKASDGRLYHPVITEMVIEMLARKTRETQRKADYRARKQAASIPRLSHGTDMGLTRESGGSDDTGTGTSSKPASYEAGSAQASPDRANPALAISDCPHQAIISLYAKHLPELPQPRVWDGQRATNLKTRWRWVLTAKKPNGERYATNASEALGVFERFFAHVAESAFLTGRNGKWQACDLAWLVKAENFAKVVEGRYQDREAA
jgi:hypothetical protein